MGPLFENVKLTEALELLIEDICDDKASLLNPDRSSGLKSDEEDDGARVAVVAPTGQGATGISVREDAEGL